MENGSFLNRLNDYSFVEDSAKNAQNRPHLPTTQSQSMEVLLRQIDDLQARLKVTVQRMSTLEADHEISLSSQHQLQVANRALYDQLLIWKEKERIWMTRIEKSEQLASQSKSFEQNIQKLQNETQRYRKYHEKMRTQIKPYIRELKDYAQNLLSQSQELHRELGNKDFEIEKANARVEFLENESRSQTQAFEKTLADLKMENKKSVENLLEGLKQVQLQNQELEIRSQRLDASLARQDELENTCIALKRSLEKAEIKSQQEEEGLRISLQLARNEILKRNLQAESQEQKMREIQSQNDNLQVQVSNLHDQVVSLRHLWGEKAKETERLQQKLSSLEQLNLELSQKFRESRSQTEQNSLMATNELRGDP